jgi:hypothetical protein
MLHSLQASLQSYQQLQKENEELKEAAAIAEACSCVLKSRVQQLEREAQVHKQQLSDLENQVLQHVESVYHHHFIVKFHRSDQGYKVCLTDIEPVIYKCYTENIQ